MEKKTFYDILGVSPKTTEADIRRVYEVRIEQLKANELRMGHEQYEAELKILNAAFDILSNPQARKVYDARQTTKPELEFTLEELDPPPGRAIKPFPNEALSREADVLSLRAEAVALRAEALATKLSLREEFPRERESIWRSSLMRFAMLVVAGVIGFLVIRMILGYSLLNQIVQHKQEATEAEERVIIQEYYQTYGVRPASAAEARLLMAERQREEKEQREAEREQQREIEERRRISEESRRIGEQVSRDLRLAEEQEERKRQRLADEKRAQEQAEQEKHRAQQEEWNRILRR